MYRKRRWTLPVNRCWQRRVAADAFFLSLYTVDLQPGEIVAGADVPVAGLGDWFGFDELSRRHGDYATAGLAVAARFEGRIVRALRLAFLGLDATPVRARRTETLLAGKILDEATIAIAVASLQGELDPIADLTHESGTKRHLATVLARRLLAAADAARSAVTA